MIDWHIHIGQWHQIYYEPKDIVTSLKESGTTEFYFSSTSSERYCKENFAVQGNTELQKTLPSACELYEFIKKEISIALETAEKLGVKAHPLYWVIPEVHFANVVSIRQAMSELPYEGFKLHPRGNVWDLTNKKTEDLAEEIFSYAQDNGKMILIHCGPDLFELPTLFEDYINRYSKVTVQLAHCRPIEDTLYMLKTYPNTVCDTAFCPKDVYKAIYKSVFSERVFFGSDFPITHWYENGKTTKYTIDSLIENYKKCINDLL